jgi:hypothetical protein
MWGFFIYTKQLLNIIINTPCDWGPPEQRVGWVGINTQQSGVQINQK